MCVCILLSSILYSLTIQRTKNKPNPAACWVLCKRVMSGLVKRGAPRRTPNTRKLHYIYNTVEVDESCHLLLSVFARLEIHLKSVHENEGRYQGRNKSRELT